MCFICDGGTEQDLLDQTHARIAEHGFTMMMVGDDRSSWAYSIGLLENFGHPELVVTGLDATSASAVITGLAERIRDGERFTAASPDTTYMGWPVRFGEVHQSQWRHGRFAMWCAYYGHRGELPANPDAVQLLWANDDDVFPPDRDFCAAHRNCQPVLSVAATRDVNLPPRRSQRRKKKRR
jgi:hypothetical protein